jgi:hypothetical protein
MEDLVFIQQFISSGLPNGELSVNVEEDEPEAGKSLIRGIVISTIDSEGQDLTSILQNVDRIILNYPDNSSFVKVNLSIISKSKHFSPDPSTTFFYLKTAPTVIDSSIIVDEEQNIRISLEPFIQNRQQLLDYDAVQANAQLQRLSSTQQVVNNIQPYLTGSAVRPLPQNLDSLIAGTADFAETVNSNYTKKGWINARYEGSLTGLTDFQGIPAYVNLREFEGIPYIDTLQVGSVNTEYLEGLQTFTLVHTGQGALPELKQTIILSNISQSIDANTTVLTLDNSFQSRAKFDRLLIPNQILRIKQDAEVDGPSELVRFINIKTVTATTTDINVTRKAAGEETALSGAVVLIFALDPCQIFRISSNQIAPLSNSWTFIPEIGKSLRTDKYGFVIAEVAPAT